MEDDSKLPDPKEEKPQIYSVSFETGKHRFSRRRFVEAAGTAAAAAALAGCGDSGLVGGKAATAPKPTDTNVPTNTPSPTPTLTPSPTATNTPTPTATSTPTPIPITVTVKNQGARVRTGPGTNYPIMGSLTINTVIKIVGKLPDDSWFKVRVRTANLPNMTDKSHDEVEGWMRADQVTLKGQPLDKVATEAVPPTPTALPNFQLQPGQKGISYKYTDPYGNIQTKSLPCGSVIPEGAVCTCNCVSICTCDGYVAPTQCTCDSQGGCSCNQVCTCDTVHYWYPN